jgi:hypothetical protein
VYAPIVQTPYFYQDDWGVFIPGGRSLGFFVDTGIIQGRILGSFAAYILSNFLNSFDSSKITRFIGIIGLTLFAFITYVIFKRCRFRPAHAFFMSTLICVLPSSQILVSWMVCIPFIFGAAMSSLSALICFDIVSKETTVWQKSRGIGILTAIILLITALNIYQTSAMMYWAMGVIFFLTWNNCSLSKKEFRPLIIKYLLVGLISIALYYLVFIIIIPSYFYPHLQTTRGSLRSISDVILILKWFITKPLKHSMNLWNLNQTKYFAIFISTVITVGIILNVWRETKENKDILVRTYFTKYFAISTMVILSFLPHLVVHSVSSYRFMIALTPALSILFCFALINIVEFFGFVPKFSSKMRKAVITILFIILAIVTSLSARNNVKVFAMLHSNEFKYVKNTLKEVGIANLSSTSKIYFKRARYLSVPVQHQHNEFQSNIVTHTIGGYIYPELYSIRGIEQAEIGGSMARYVVKLALHELGVKQDIHITHGAFSDPVPEDKNILIIDMLKYQIGSQIMRLVDFGYQESLIFQGPGWSSEPPSLNASWTIARTTSLIGQLPVQESIKMIARLRSPHPDQKLGIRVNGRLIATWSIDRTKGFHEYSATIKLTNAENNSLSRIEFITDKINIVPDNDERKLGILVDWIQFE